MMALIEGMLQEVNYRVCHVHQGNVFLVVLKMLVGQQDKAHIGGVNKATKNVSRVQPPR